MSGRKDPAKNIVIWAARVRKMATSMSVLWCKAHKTICVVTLLGLEIRGLWLRVRLCPVQTTLSSSKRQIANPNHHSLALDCVRGPQWESTAAVQ